MNSEQIKNLICLAATFASMLFVNVLVFSSSSPALIGTVAAFGFVSLGLFSLSYWKNIRSLDVMIESLEKKDTRIPVAKMSPEHRVLGEIFNSFIDDTQAYSKENKKHQDEIGLQLQLLRKQKHNTEAIIYSIRDAVIVVDNFNRVALANDASEKLFNFKFREIGSKELSEILKHDDLVSAIVSCRQSKSRHVRHEITVDKGGDNVIILDCVLSSVRDDRGDVCDVAAVLHDITKEKEISQMKNDFVSHVSHELKTPLASINAYAEMLVDGEAEDQETISQFCSIIQSQAQRLNRLIEDILNISRIESGLIKVEKQEVSMALLIREATEMIKSYAQEKNISIHTPPSILYDQVHADKDMMSQVIINLLSNAVKYTKQGGQISVESEVNDADGYIKVSITDTGVGIPPEDVDHVFDKFFRVEANKKVAKGTGLGLNLVKQIVEKVHNGQVFVTSVKDQGSTFGFELPLSVKQTIESA